MKRGLFFINMSVVLASILLMLLLFPGCATKKAAESPRVVQKKLPKEELPPYESIGYYLNAGDTKSALAAFDKAKASNPDSVETKNLYSSLLLAAGKFEKADSVVKEALSMAPDNVDALYNKAMLEDIKGAKGDEKNTLKKILEINPGDSRALASLGELYLSEKNYPKAQENFLKSIKEDSSNITARSGYGNLLLRQKKYDLAKKQFDLLIDEKPDYPFAYSDRSKAKSGLNDAKGALSDLDKAIELDKGYYWNYIDRGKLLAFTGDVKGAIADFSQAIELNPEYFYPYIYRAGLYREEGKLADSLKDYEKVVEKRPDYYFVYEPLGVLSFMSGKYNEAAKAFIKAKDRWPDEPSYFLMAAVSYESAGNRDEADKILKKEMGNLSGDSYFRDLARLFTENNYDMYIISKIEKEKKLPLKMRVLFYIAEYYKLKGNKRLANKYFLEVADAKIYGMFETDLAENEVKDAMKK